MSRRLAAFPAVVALAVALGAFPACESLRSWIFAGDRCVLSERPIHSNMAVRVEVADGPAGRACCLRCAITYSRQTGKTVRVRWVTDFAGGKPIPPARAVYVVGSDVAPCATARDIAAQGRRELLAEMWDRCRTSTIAFADRARARAFQDRHGGTVETFAELVGSEKVQAASNDAS